MGPPAREGRGDGTGKVLGMKANRTFAKKRSILTRQSPQAVEYCFLEVWRFCPLKPYRAHPQGGGDPSSSPLFQRITSRESLIMAPYRDCASYLRSSAQKMRHADNKRILLATADRYDQLASSLELRSRTPIQPEQAEG